MVEQQGSGPFTPGENFGFFAGMAASYYPSLYVKDTVMSLTSNMSVEYALPITMISTACTIVGGISIGGLIGREIGELLPKYLPKEKNVWTDSRMMISAYNTAFALQRLRVFLT